MSHSSASPALGYLLVSHIPFMRTGDGDITLDHLWARDLEGLSSAIGPVRVVAPELPPGASLASWGPTSTTLSSKGPLSFIGLPTVASHREGWKWPRIRAILRAEVDHADLVHSSNLFPPYVGLSYAHDRATRLGKKTIFVIAEDFYDMLAWEWVRLGATGFERWWRHRALVALDARVRKSAAQASLTFLHTPAAVERYRLSTRCGIAIRQPGHEQEEVISDSALAEKCAAIRQGVPLVIIAACRHKPLKGLDFLIDAVALLAAREIRVEARIYGDGDFTPQLRAQVVRRNLTDRVSFPGALSPGPSIYESISSGHLFAMAHRTTDFGRAFWDAMAGGSPVVAFRTAASVGTVRDGVDGLLAPLDDVEGLASVIERFHAERTMLIRACEAARARALVNTRSAWFQFRAECVRELFTEGKTR